jgi:heat shock protein HtpX
MAVGLLIAAIQSIFALRYGDRMVLRSTRARVVTPEENPRLHNIVEGIAIAAGIPKPAVYVVPEQAPNAFATGRDPAHSSIAVTQGLLDIMNRVELEGVIAHELSHVEDRDMLVGTVIATTVGAIVLISEFFLRWMFWGGIGGRRDNENGGGLEIVFLVIGVALLILAPIAAAIIQMAVSRKREFLADANGALLTRYPPGLASALKKIAVAPHAMRSANNATAHLWLDQPSKVQGEKIGRMERLFSTHPPIQERIKRLEEM